MSLDELFTEHFDECQELTYQEVQELWINNQISYAEKCVLEKATQDWKLYEQDIKEGVA